MTTTTGRDFLWRLGINCRTEEEIWPTIIILYDKDGHEGKGAFLSKIMIELTNTLGSAKRDMKIKNSIGRRAVI